jgi:hypothetical protein
MKPGDLVKCVNVGALPYCTNRNLNLLTLGQIYTVKSLATYSSTQGIFLEEVLSPIDVMFGAEVAFDCRRFRVVTKPNIDVFRSARVKELEPA